MLLSGPDCKGLLLLCSYMSMQLRTLFGIGMTAEGSSVRYIAVYATAVPFSFVIH